jgi:acyl-CoA thioester hydrolase
MRPVDDDRETGEELPSVVVQRRVEWHDTDAAGHHHHGAVLRWVESAESVLLHRRDATALYGRIPRVHYEVDYRNRVFYGQVVEIELAVERVGVKSVRYAFVVRAGDQVAATGNLVMAMASLDSPGAMALPAEIRLALTTGGRQRPETIC